MRLAILLMLLAALSRNAAAAWSELRKGEPETFAVLTDPATIRKADNIVRMWVLFDYKTAQVVGTQTFLSERAQEEYDCKDARIRVLVFSDHTENMAAGKVVLRTSIPGDWTPVEPGSISEVLWNFACMNL